VLLTTTFFCNIIQVSVIASAVIFALVLALGLVGMVAVQVLGSEHEAEAKGCNNTITFNTSKGRYFHTWLGEEVRFDR
jgi:hypothetical protein